MNRNRLLVAQHNRIKSDIKYYVSTLDSLPSPRISHSEMLVSYINTIIKMTVSLNLYEKIEECYTDQTDLKNVLEGLNDLIDKWKEKVFYRNSYVAHLEQAVSDGIDNIFRGVVCELQEMCKELVVEIQLDDIINLPVGSVIDYTSETGNSLTATTLTPVEWTDLLEVYDVRAILKNGKHVTFLYDLEDQWWEME